MRQRGDVHWGQLDPQKGSEQGGLRPVLIIQDETLLRTMLTLVVIPITGNTHLSNLPTCVFIPAGTAGLTSDSVAHCHQIRVLDLNGIRDYLGTMPPNLMRAVEDAVIRTLQL